MTTATHPSEVRLRQAVKNTKADVVGWQKIIYHQHAELVATALEAFGDDERATFYVEVLAPQANIPRPDLIMLHPAVGVIVIENKGIKLSDIVSVEGTALRLTRDGRLKEEDPFHQADRVMYALRDLTSRRVDLSQALFLSTAALPRIGRDQFERKFEVQWPREALFAEECASAAAFRDHVLTLSRFHQRNAVKSCLLSKRAHDAIMMILKGKSVLAAARRIYLEDADPHLLGAQIQDMELALKEPTQQQKELGRADLRGKHWLFRGVAGSGKSIMLALSTSQTLATYHADRGLFDADESKRVLVVCFNRTLVHYLAQRINDCYCRQTWDQPSPKVLTVTHFEGLVRDLETAEPKLMTGLDFRKKHERAQLMTKKLIGLSTDRREKLLFDAIYVDEAQDLGPEELGLLQGLARKTREGSQTLILFYDNAQNIYGVQLPIWAKLGINIVGRTVFMDQCLRNTTQTLELAFNVLIGAIAAPGERVTTRAFADVESLRQRGLIKESNGRFEIGFTKRSGPKPVVRQYHDRKSEIEGTVAEIRRLITDERVLPNDILIIYNSHHSFTDLTDKLSRCLPRGSKVRCVDSAHNANKDQPLLEDGTLTISTIASAKGYDAPIVFFLGIDELDTTTQDRASFYVGATRAKLHLFATGIKTQARTLLDEILDTNRMLEQPAAPKPTSPASNPIKKEKQHKSDLVPKQAEKKCRHCGSPRLHAQYGKFSYFFRCIDCTGNTPMDTRCSKCDSTVRIRKEGDRFHRDCSACGTTEVYHTNISLLELNG